jgi:Peptidase family M23
MYQTYSPEINHYKHYNQIERFKTQNFIQVFLPFLGEWRVSQGHNGEITHKDDWKEAWDFDIQDDQGKTYRMPGKNTDDYYCYNLPVLAPANGYVAEVRDGIDDNKIGDSDLENNWGNTIIIKHAEFLYSNLSHLKKGSINVKKDDYVKKGDIIAYVGNSGRSPEPHLHFQFQSTRYVGSKTMKYPFSFFIQNDNGKYVLRENDIPQKDELVSNIKTTDILKKSFNFPPGKVFKFDVSGLDEIDIIKWEVFTTSYNQRYIYCHHSKSYAYFVESGNVFYFTDFTGDKKSLLYYFYLGAQKVLLGYYEGVGISDKLLTHGLFRGPLLFLQDFVAPFHHFLHAGFKAEFTDIDDTFNPTGIKIKSSANTYLFGKLYKSIDFEFVLTQDALNYFLVKKDGKLIKASCISN